MIIEPPPSSELLGMKAVIPDEPMSPDEDPGKIMKTRCVYIYIWK